MRDSYTELRTEYYSALQGNITLNAATVNVYDVVKADEDTPYIYFADFEFREESCKDDFSGIAEVTLMVITKYTNAVGGSKDSDNIGNQILQLIHNDSYLSSTNFRLATNKLLENSTEKVFTKTGTQIVKTIRIEHYVEQVGGDLVAITDLAAIRFSTSQINLSWSRVTGNAGYKIERSLDCKTWTLIGTNATDLELAIDTGLTADTIYHYRVRAIDSSGGSGWSNIASAETTTLTASCADGNVQNTDLSYLATVASGGNLTLPDITFTDYDGSTSSVPAVKNVTATQQSGIAYNRPISSGQETSYRTGDDKDQRTEYTGPDIPEFYAILDYNSATSWLTLENNNAFGNKNRFTDEAGGQDYNNDYAIDHHTGLGWYLIEQRGGDAADNWNNKIDDALASTAYVFSDWRLPNIKEYDSVLGHETGRVGLNYSPFSYSVSATLVSSTTDGVNTANCMAISNSNLEVDRFGKTVNFGRYFICRNHYT